MNKIKVGDRVKISPHPRYGNLGITEPRFWKQKFHIVSKVCGGDIRVEGWGYIIDNEMVTIDEGVVENE